VSFFDTWKKLVADGIGWSGSLNEDINYLLVREGKYYGLWQYDKRTKRLQWEYLKPRYLELMATIRRKNYKWITITDVFGVPHRERSHQTQTLPFPDFVQDYHVNNGNANKFAIISNTWRIFHPKLEALLKVAAPRYDHPQPNFEVLESEQERLAREEYEMMMAISSRVDPEMPAHMVKHYDPLLDHHAWREFAMLMVGMVGEHTIDWTMRPYNIKMFENLEDIIKSLGARKRQNFLKRWFEVGLKKAFRATFRKTHPNIINRIVNEVAKSTPIALNPMIELLDCEIQLPSSYSMQELYDAALWISEYPRVAERREWWRFFEQYSMSAINIVEVAKYEEDRIERHGVEIDLPERPPLFPFSPKQWADYHNTIVRLYREHEEALTNREKKMQLERKLALVERVDSQVMLPWGVMLLTTPLQYIEEGRVMRHCVGSYWLSPINILSIEQGTERATAEIDQNGWIRQLRGVCNASPSEKMVEFVRNLVDVNKGKWK
jgi:hypothetical protein